METNTDERLERAVTILTELIELAGEFGLAQSELFLSMAKLQLQLDLNGITDEEFAAFCDAVESGTLKPASAARAGQGRPRRDGDLRGMGRAWQVPEGIVAPRRGGRRVKQ
jgi:hypothetical protein